MSFKEKFATIVGKKRKSKLQLAMVLALGGLSFVFLWYLVHWWIIVIALLAALNLAAVISYQRDVAVPFLETLLARRYLRLKAKLEAHAEVSFWARRYQKFLQYLLILFLNSQRSFELLFGGDSPFGIKFDQERQTLQIKAKMDEVRQAYTAEFFDLYKLKKKKIVAVSLGASAGIILSIIILVFIIPSWHKLNAYTYGWVQTSWTGGASTTTVAVHPGDKTNWLQYFWASANMFISTSLTPNSVATSTTDTTDADWQTGTSTNAYITGDKVVMLKPQGATCNASAECALGYCDGSPGTCFNCGVDTVQYEGGPYDADGIATSTGGYYRTVLIGTQCWLKDNLNVGTMIGSKLADNTTVQDQTNNSTIEKYCWGYVQQDNAGQIATGAANCAVYGGFYQWPEALAYNNGITLTSGNPSAGNIQGICPTNWHIPSDTEYTTLSTYLGGDTVAGGAMKETGLTHWDSPNASSTNSSGFTGLGAGYRYTNGSFYNRGSYAYFWSTLPNGSPYAWDRGLNSNNGSLSLGSYSERARGFSIRCLKGL